MEKALRGERVICLGTEYTVSGHFEITPGSLAPKPSKIKQTNEIRRLSVFRPNV
jgi:hypothetical protein